MTQAATVVTRAVSSATTGGLGNPVIATIETGSSMLIGVLVVLLPIVGIVLFGVVMFFVIRAMMRRHAAKTQANSAAI